MKSMTTKILALTAALFGLQLSAATPVAVWDGDFTGADTSAGATRGSFTIRTTASGTVASDKSYVTVGEGTAKTGVLVDWATSVATSDAGFKNKKITMIVRYENLEDATYIQTLSTLWTGSSGSETTAAYKDRIGFLIDQKSATHLSYGIYQGSLRTDGTKSSVTCSTSTSLNSMAVTYDASSTGYKAYFRMGSETSFTVKYEDGKLRQGNENIYGITIGGTRMTPSTTSWNAAKRMKIRAVAIFNTNLSAAELAAYKFPSDMPHTSVISVNLGTSGRDGTESWTVSAGTDPGAVYADSNWYNAPNPVTDNMTVGRALLSCKAKNNWSNSGQDKAYNKGYLDDGTATGITGPSVTISCLKNGYYNLVIYCSSDNANRFSYKTVNGKNYTYDSTTGAAKEGTASWGSNGTGTSEPGNHALLIKNLQVTDGTIAISSIRKDENGENAYVRGCISAIQIAEATYEATVTGNCNWSALTWSPVTPQTGSDVVLINGSTGVATVTLDGAVSVGKLTVTSAAGKDLTFAPGSGSMTATSYDFSGANGKVTVGFDTGNTPVKAGADTVLTSVNNPTLTIASGKKLTVKGGSLQETTTTNNGTLNFEGGTAANPIVYTTKNEASDPGKMILASGTYVRMVTFNKKKEFDITGAGAAESTCEIYTSDGSGQGMPSNISFRNLTLVVSSSFSGENALWFESTSACVDKSVDLVVNGNMKVNISGLSIGSLSGAGNIVKYGDYDGLTITPSSNAEYSGTSAVAFTIADSDYVQLITGNYTGALTVNSGATVGLKSASPAPLTVASGAHLIVGANTSAAAINITGGTSGLNLSGVTLDIDSFEETAISESAATYKLISDSHGFNTDTMILGDSLTKGDWAVTVEGNVLQAQKKNESVYITIDPTTGEATHDTTSRAALDIDRAWIDDKCGTAGKSAAEVTAALNETAANGTKPWESYVLGLDPNTATSVPVIQPAQAASSNGAIAFQLSNVAVNAKAGADVTYKVVMGSTQGGSDLGESESASPDETISVDLPTSGVKYYKLQVDITNQ